jgi:CRISPR-associated protein Csm5
MLTPKPITRVLDVRLYTLTPLHIGTGNTLMKDIDFVSEGQQTRRLDVDRILSELWDENLSRRATPPRPAELLQSIPRAEWEPYTAYMARGAIVAGSTGAQLREQIKTVDFQPYIPGSSIKGAIRTALGWAGWPEAVRERLDPQRDFRTTAKFAGQPLEDKLFRPAAGRGDGPNKDLLRALQTGDMRVTKFENGYQICNVRVASRTKYDSPIECEAIGKDARFRGQWTLHDHLFDPSAQALGLKDRRGWVDLNNLVARINAHSLAQLEWLKRDFLAKKELDGSRKQAEFCEGLRQQIETLSGNRCVLRVGWGGGWDNKTFSSRLSTAPSGSAEMFERNVIQGYKLYRGKGRRQPGDPFPTTRRVVVREKGRDYQIDSMFGWVLLDFKAIER